MDEHTVSLACCTHINVTAYVKSTVQKTGKYGQVFGKINEI